MKLLGTTIAPLGMGCWPIGGPFFHGDKHLGYANAKDDQSIRTIHAALDAGITLFDTAAVYGAGHAERLLGRALGGAPDAIVISKIGIGFDEATKQVDFAPPTPGDILPAIDACLARMDRDTIDIMLLHQNALPIAQAHDIFAQMDRARDMGKIRGFGWSTDFPASVAAMTGTPGFVAVEHAMNLYFDAPSMQDTITKNDLAALIRSPLAMGVLTGKFGPDSRVNPDDIRAADNNWDGYFQNAQVAPGYLEQLGDIRDLLQTGGRTLPQGALCWLMAKSAQNIPLPGARTVAQITDNAGAISYGPLPKAVMDEIETILDRPPEGPPRER